jgi:hypothetical protein
MTANTFLLKNWASWNLSLSISIKGFLRNTELRGSWLQIVILLLMRSLVAGITGTYYHTQLVCWNGVLPNLSDPLSLCLLRSWDYRYEPPHPAWYFILFDASINGIVSFCFFLFSFFLMVPEFELRTSGFLGRCSTLPTPFFVLLLFFFISTRDWTQDLALVRQVRYHLSHASSPMWALTVVVISLAGLQARTCVTTLGCTLEGLHTLCTSLLLSY